MMVNIPWKAYRIYQINDDIKNILDVFDMPCWEAFYSKYGDDTELIDCIVSQIVADYLYGLGEIHERRTDKK